MRHKSQAEKALSGTQRLDRSGKHRAKVVTTHEVPRPQKYLSRKAKAIYKEICLHLIKHNSLCKIDSHYISGIAHAFDIYIRMAEELEKPEVGIIQTFDNGTRNFSPEYSVMLREWKRIEDGCKAIGLNLKARETILAYAKENEKSEEADPLLRALRSN